MRKVNCFVYKNIPSIRVFNLTQKGQKRTKKKAILQLLTWRMAFFLYSYAEVFLFQLVQQADRMETLVHCVNDLTGLSVVPNRKYFFDFAFQGIA